MLKNGTKINNYEVVEKLGEGAQGWVYKVRWETRYGERTGALKLLNSSQFKDILKEVSNWAKVSQHPNILTFINADEEHGKFFILSELASDGDLDQLIKQGKTQNIPFDTSVGLMKGVLDGLDHLHFNEIIHRDIKPSNILLNAGIPLLADFGLARGLNFTQSSNLSGTLYYLSPEQVDFCFNQKADSIYERTEADDLWAASVTFHQLLAGILPFNSPDDIRHCNRCILPQALPQSLQSFFDKALAKNPADRFQTAREMRHYLADLPVSNYDETVEDFKVSQSAIKEDFSKTNQPIAEDEKDDLSKTNHLITEDETEFTATNNIIDFGLAFKNNVQAKQNQEPIKVDSESPKPVKKRRVNLSSIPKDQKKTVAGMFIAIIGLFLFAMGAIILLKLRNNRTSYTISNAQPSITETKEDNTANKNSMPSVAQDSIANTSNPVSEVSPTSNTGSNNSKSVAKQPTTSQELTSSQSSPPLTPKVSPKSVSPKITATPIVTTPSSVPPVYTQPRKTPNPNERCLLTDDC